LGELTLAATKPEKEYTDSSVGDEGMIDLLAIFTGVLSVFLAAILTTIDLLLKPGLLIPNVGGSPVAVAISSDSMIFFAAILAILAIATVLNDLLTTRTGRRFTIHVSLILGFLGALLYFLNVPAPLYLTLTAMSICLFTLIWGSVLSTLNSQVLTFMLMSICIFIGIVVLIGTQLTSTETFALLILFYIISWLSIQRVSRASLDRIAFASRRQSIERHVRGKGNSFTLVLVGGMFGTIAVLASSVELALGELTLALGTCLLLAGLIVVFFYRNLHSSLGNVAKRTLSLAMIISLAPFPFLDRVGQMICICFLFVASTVNLILIIDSILETSRFNQISPVWIIGLEGGIFFVGALAVPACTTILIALSAQGLEIMILVLVAASAILQIHINNQAYPLFSMPTLAASEPLGGELLTGDAAAHETLGHVSAFWRERIDRIAVEYRLSNRQKEIMELLIRGWDLSYITTHYHISRSTAKTHISNLYRKMGIHSKQELIDMMEPLQHEGRPRR
jgi:DNA-binding CsgD family transcriptional regulator